jgi:hypothetical protein
VSQAADSELATTDRFISLLVERPPMRSVLAPMTRVSRERRIVVTMTAQTIKDAETRLHELRQDEWSDLSLAAVAMGLALVASFLRPSLALPLFIGALASAVLAGRALFRRLELFDHLLLDRDAYAIPEIRRRAENMASMESRRTLAQAVRTRLTPAPGYGVAERVALAAEELKSLAAELDDETLSLDPACAVRCDRLLNNYADSPLLNTLLPAQDVQLWIRQIRSGFQPQARKQRPQAEMAASRKEVGSRAGCTGDDGAMADARLRIRRHPRARQRADRRSATAEGVGRARARAAVPRQAASPADRSQRGYRDAADRQVEQIDEEWKVTAI